MLFGACNTTTPCATPGCTPDTKGFGTPANINKNSCEDTWEGHHLRHPPQWIPHPHITQTPQNTPTLCIPTSPCPPIWVTPPTPCTTTCHNAYAGTPTSHPPPTHPKQLQLPPLLRLLGCTTHPTPTYCNRWWLYVGLVMSTEDWWNRGMRLRIVGGRRRVVLSVIRSRISSSWFLVRRVTRMRRMKLLISVPYVYVVSWIFAPKILTDSFFKYLNFRDKINIFSDVLISNIWIFAPKSIFSVMYWFFKYRIYWN